MACTFNFVNDKWEQGVNTWVKDGPENDCEQKSEKGKYFLKLNEELPIDSNNSICWRRETVPGRVQPDSEEEIQYELQWHNEACFDNAVRILIR